MYNDDMVWFISHIFASEKLRTYTLELFIFFDISQPLRGFTMLSPNMTTDFPFFCSLFVFLYFSCSEFIFLFCWSLLPFPVFVVKFLFSVAAFIVLVSMTIIAESNKSSPWVVFCCTSYLLESMEQCILSDVFIAAYMNAFKNDIITSR